MSVDSKKMASKSIFIFISIACFTPFINSSMALILGFGFAYFLGQPFAAINSKLIGLLLKVAVIGLGFGMNVTETLKAGMDGLVLTIIVILVIFSVGYLLGRLLKIPTNITHLISSGTAICGGSAIAAVSPIIKASERDISMSIGVIFLLNAIALLIFPSIGSFLELTQYEFGMWSAIAIHDTSSVLGAAQVYGSEALQVATAVKMGRVLWIIPISIVTIFAFGSKEKTLKIPWFILLFITAIAVSNYFSFSESIVNPITTYSRSILVFTLFLVGSLLSIQKIKAAGMNPLILGISLWVLISIVSLVSITQIGII